MLQSASWSVRAFNVKDSTHQHQVNIKMLAERVLHCGSKRDDMLQVSIRIRVRMQKKL